MKLKALFLDRDGTLIYDKHYLHQPELVEFIPHALKALKAFKEKGYLFYVITNQSGIGRGMFREEEMHAVHKKMDEILAQADIEIQKYLHCPHSPEDSCDCRKPSPKLINEILSTQDFDETHCYMLGDKDSDVQAGINAGINGVLIKKDADSSRPGDFLDLKEFYESLYNNA